MSSASQMITPNLHKKGVIVQPDDNDYAIIQPNKTQNIKEKLSSSQMKTTML
jgi:hypothetical protein